MELNITNLIKFTIHSVCVRACTRITLHAHELPVKFVYLQITGKACKCNTSVTETSTGSP